jgi:hypothetical protein
MGAAPPSSSLIHSGCRWGDVAVRVVESGRNARRGRGRSFDILVHHRTWDPNGVSAWMAQRLGGRTHQLDSAHIMGTVPHSVPSLVRSGATGDVVVRIVESGQNEQ